MPTERTLARQWGMRGFTLLEAIVALTIIGTALIPVMSFLAESSRQIARASEAAERAEAQRTITAFLQFLNPNKNPTGIAKLSSHLGLRWISTPLTDPAVERLGGRLGSYRIIFYRVDVMVLRGDEEWFEFQARKIGYEPRSFSMGGGVQ